MSDADSALLGAPRANPVVSQNARREELLALLSLLQLDGLGPQSLSHLLAHYGSATHLVAVAQSESFTLDPDCLQALGRRATGRLCAFLRAPRSSGLWQLARQSLDWLERAHGRVLLRGDADFPPRLREIYDCPPLLFLRGDVQCLSKPCIAIVGTRRPTALGRRMACDLAAGLGAQGMTICSGLALGIDAEAHRSALQAGASTLAVLATGVDTIYPASHRELAEHVIDGGALVSEMPLGTPAVPGLFPRRNRLVSGACCAVIVVEAGLPSGSLHTANFAADQNREVFAVPGAANNPMARGCNQLIREGAHVVESLSDVLAVLDGLSGVGIGPQKTPDIESKPIDKQQLNASLSDLCPVQRGLLQALEEVGEPADFEQLCMAANTEVPQAAQALVELELRGLVLFESGRYSLAVQR